jgi:hypothetical protein
MLIINSTLLLLIPCFDYEKRINFVEGYRPANDEFKNIATKQTKAKRKNSQ